MRHNETLTDSRYSSALVVSRYGRITNSKRYSARGQSCGIACVRSLSGDAGADSPLNEILAST